MNKEESVEFARSYVADLLSFFGINVAVEASVQDDVIELSVPATDINSLLIGRNAETLRSLQFLVSTVLRNKNADLTRVNLDIADYKKQRAEKIAKYITKGLPVTVTGKFGLRTYTTKNGPGASITCDVADIALQGGKPSEASQAAPVPFDDKKAADNIFDDSVPF